MKNGERIKGNKSRDIYYANHLDANIFAYYAYELSKYYEEILKQKQLTDVVTAYRRNNGKCNIDFAKEVFDYIEQRANIEDLVVMTFDIKGFFDNLNHRKLKENWSYILSRKTLPKDHYNVFKNITKFSYVEKEKLFKLFQNEIIVETKSGIRKKKLVKKMQYLYEQNAIAFCESKDIHKIRAQGLIHSNKFNPNNSLRIKGICQGSPISAVLANIYMITFDEYMNNLITELGGMYRRYSDDMVIICPCEYKARVRQELEEKINSLTKLEIQSSKTQIFCFGKRKNKLICMQEFNGKYKSNRNFEYLGFGFNGKNVYLKAAALAKFYRKMKFGVKRCVFYSRHIQNSTNGQIFINRLYKRYSYIGAKVRRRNGQKNHGNFITYVNNASKIFRNPGIRKQVRNHWKILNKAIKQ